MINTVNGSDLMAFVTVNGKLKSVAYATNHTLSVQCSTVDVSCKDFGNGRWQAVERGLQSWSVTSDNFMALEGENGASFNDLFDIYLMGDEVEIAFSLQTDNIDYSKKLGEEFVAPNDGWTYDASNCYKGKALITDLSITAQNGEKATFNVTFQGVGNLLKIGNGIQKKN